MSMTWTSTPCVPEAHHLVVVGKPSLYLEGATGRKYPECTGPYATAAVALNKPQAFQVEVTLKLTLPGDQGTVYAFAKNAEVVQPSTGHTGKVKAAKTITVGDKDTKIQVKGVK